MAIEYSANQIYYDILIKKSQSLIFILLAKNLVMQMKVIPF